MSEVSRPDKNEYMDYHRPAEAYMDQLEQRIKELTEQLDAEYRMRKALADRVVEAAEEIEQYKFLLEQAKTTTRELVDVLDATYCAWMDDVQYGPDPAHTQEEQTARVMLAKHRRTE